MTRFAILFSGRGSNMAALLEAAAQPGFPAQPVLALCNVADAPGIALARAHGVETRCIPHRGLTRPAHEAALQRELDAHLVELICLAGYMRLLTPDFAARWAGRMLNIHPSLLPAFPGLDPHGQALAGGVKLHGCTVHLVTEATDSGPILAQAAVPVLPDDDPATLAARVLRQEHRLYPLALRAFLEHDAIPADAGAALLNPLPLPGA